jgi:hypothetical protein
MSTGIGARDDGGITGLGLAWAARCTGISLKYASSCIDRDFASVANPPSDELKLARDDYLHDLTKAWRRGAGKKEVVPNAHKASNNDAAPVQDMETMYRRYAEEISQAWKAPR